MIVSDELESKTALVCFKVAIFKNLFGGTEESHKYLNKYRKFLIQDLNLRHAKNETGGNGTFYLKKDGEE
jgi:hypothetical protein